MPKNCFFGDTEPIPDAMRTHIRQVLKEQQIKWPWCQGDVLVLVNLRVSHGRTSFGDTERRILEHSFLISSTRVHSSTSLR